MIRPFAIVLAYNEADILPWTVRHLVAEGCDVHVIDNWSTDGSVDLAIAGGATVECWPASGPSDVWDLSGMLVRVEEVALAHAGRWIIYCDADEIRRAPAEDGSIEGNYEKTLEVALAEVRAAGFNAVNHRIAQFAPVDDDYTGDPERYFRHVRARCSDDQNNHIKAWWQDELRVDLHSGGGHGVDFPKRRVYPIPFILKHYPFRTQSQGERKVFRERRARYSAAEVSRGWHKQYVGIMPGHCFIESKDQLEFVGPYKASIAEAVYESSVRRSEVAVGDRQGTSQILGAAWGNVDVTDVVEEIVRRGELSIVASRDVLGDVHFGTQLSLVVVYRCDDGIRTGIAAEGTVLRLDPWDRSQPVFWDSRGKIKIIGAAYGLSNVTEALQKIVYSGQSSVTADNKTFGDSWVTVLKTLVVVYRDIAGQLRVKIVEESKSFTFSVEGDDVGEEVAGRQAFGPLERRSDLSSSDGLTLSVIFGTFNRLASMQEAIRSVRDSVGNLDYEIVVCDGGSTDGTREWLAVQPDVILLGKRTLDGAVDAFNHCFNLSRGRFVSALNDDARVVGKALSEGVAHLQNDEGCGQVAFSFRGDNEGWHINRVYPDSSWSTVYANFGVTRRSAIEAVRYITGGMWAPVYRTYAGDCELSAWIHRMGMKIALREDLRVEDIRLKDGLRARNEEFANFEAGLFYSRWPCEAFRANGITPNVSEGELSRYLDVVEGRWSPVADMCAKEIRRCQESLDYVRSAPLPWPLPERERFLSAAAPLVRALDPQSGCLPRRAEVLRRSERVVHFHLGTEVDPQDALVRAVRSLAPDEASYRRIDWLGRPTYEVDTLALCAEIKPTFVFMQIQTPGVVSPEMIDGIRKRSDPSVVVATWNGDVASNNSPWSVEWQVPLGRAVDLTLHSSMTHVRALRAAGVHTAAYLQIGYDQEQYKSLQSDARPNDVCFLGSRYYSDEFSKSMRVHDGPLRDAIIDAMRKEFGRRFALYGAGYGEGVEPIPILRSHEAFQAAKLAVSISLSNEFELYSSDRLHRALGCGGAVLLKRFSRMDCWGLRHEENCLVWDTVDEAVALARKAISTGSWKRIGAAGAKLAARHHTWDVRMMELQLYLDAVRVVR